MSQFPQEWEVEWERVLWKPKPYPDNYVPKSFLASLSKNQNFKPHTYISLVPASWTIVQHLAVIFIFLATFVRLRERTLDPRLLVWISIILFTFGYSLWQISDWSRSDASRLTDAAKAIKSSILVFLALLALSPVLRTLTAATSSDSIWALSAGLFSLNVLLADYSPLPLNSHPRDRLSSVLSTNAAISASVVLASRLIDDMSVFALMLFSIQSFALFPTLRRRTQTIPIGLQALLTTGLSSLSLYLTVSLSTTVVYIYLAIFGFIMFVAPGMLVWAQKFKNEIRGTWDPAVPKVNTVDVHRHHRVAQLHVSA